MRVCGEATTVALDRGFMGVRRECLTRADCLTKTVFVLIGLGEGVGEAGW